MNPATRPAHHKTAMLLMGGVVIIVAATFAAFLGAKGCTPTPPPALVIARDTTWFTAPLLPDGGIDYPGALGAEFASRGVDATNNGAPLLQQALAQFVDPWSHATARAEAGIDGSKLGGAIDAAIAAMQRGETAGPDATFLQPWLDASESALALAAKAALQPHCLVAPTGLLLERADPFPALPALTLAFELRLAQAAARGSQESALADARTALALARIVAPPPTFGAQALALEREAGTLAQLCRSARGATPLPAATLLAQAELQPASGAGDSALREALLAARIEVLDQLTAAWRGRAEIGPDPQDGSAEAGQEHARAASAVGQALAVADPNPVFRHANERFDALDAALLGSDRPLPARLDAFLARLDELLADGRPLPPQRTGPLGRALLSADQLAEHVVDVLLGAAAARLEAELLDWMAQVVACESSLAELATLADAPRRRDRLLGEPLTATMREDGNCEVTGALLELRADLQRRRSR